MLRRSLVLISWHLNSWWVTWQIFWVPVLIADQCFLAAHNSFLESKIQCWVWVHLLSGVVVAAWGWWCSDGGRALQYSWVARALRHQHWLNLSAQCSVTAQALLIRWQQVVENIFAFRKRLWRVKVKPRKEALFCFHTWVLDKSILPRAAQLIVQCFYVMFVITCFG